MSHDTVFAFETKGTASLDFSVIQHSAMDSLDDSAGERGLTTESEYFNSELHIDYSGDRGLVGADIMQVLSPHVQEALLSFNRKHDEFRMDVSKGVLLLAFGGDLPAGAMDIQRAIDSAVGLAETMLRCLDRVAG